MGAIRLKRQLHVRHSSYSGDITVGVLPPVRRVIRSPPPGLMKFLRAIGQGIKVEDVPSLAVKVGLPLDRLSDIISDLLEIGVVEPVYAEDRFDRHKLYFDLLGVPPLEYTKRLEKASVGIIGTGGIGSTTAILLATAGIGMLTISDADHVELTNLTRTVLFEESDVGARKVQAAKRRLRARNRNAKIRTVCKSFDDVSLLRHHFLDCDVWLLSADVPESLHRKTIQLAAQFGKAVIQAGYVEVHGIVGPFYVPGTTPCPFCSWEPIREREGAALRQPQAASYGPLNAVVSSMAANEIIRFFVGLMPRTFGCRLVMDSRDYATTFDHMRPKPGCKACNASVKGTLRRPDGLAEVYERDRDIVSANAVALDGCLVELLRGISKRRTGMRLLDAGCGIGTFAAHADQLGFRVTAIDPDPGMIRIAKQRYATNRQINFGVGGLPLRKQLIEFDVILCNMVLDHVRDLQRGLTSLWRAAKHDATLLITLPHPFKDGGAWHKRFDSGQWKYDEFVINNYFTEGLQSRTRENALGNQEKVRLTTAKRTLGTYFNALVDAGFMVARIEEPRPSYDSKGSIAWEKTSRVPYFLILLCKKTS